jgi:hypothetical protein
MEPDTRFYEGWDDWTVLASMGFWMNISFVVLGIAVKDKRILTESMAIVRLNFAECFTRIRYLNLKFIVYGIRLLYLDPVCNLKKKMLSNFQASTKIYVLATSISV